MDNDGYFRITDRMKDIIITAGGKNITPYEIENQLKFSPYITDAVVIGDRRAYLTALIMIDHENVEKFAQDQRSRSRNYTSLCRAPEIQDADLGRDREGQRQFARVEQVKKFRLIETEAHRRGRGAHADDEAQAQAGRKEIRERSRRCTRWKPACAAQLNELRRRHDR